MLWHCRSNSLASARCFSSQQASPSRQRFSQRMSARSSTRRPTRRPTSPASLDGRRRRRRSLPRTWSTAPRPTTRRTRPSRRHWSRPSDASCSSCSPSTSVCSRDHIIIVSIIISSSSSDSRMAAPQPHDCSLTHRMYDMPRPAHSPSHNPPDYQ